MDQVIDEALAEAQLEERGAVGSGPSRVRRIVRACEPPTRFDLSIIVARLLYHFEVTYLRTRYEGEQRYLERQMQEEEPPPN